MYRLLLILVMMLSLNFSQAQIRKLLMDHDPRLSRTEGDPNPSIYDPNPQREIRIPLVGGDPFQKPPYRKYEAWQVVMKVQGDKQNEWFDAQEWQKDALWFVPLCMRSDEHDEGPQFTGANGQTYKIKFEGEDHYFVNQNTGMRRQYVLTLLPGHGGAKMG